MKIREELRAVSLEVQMTRDRRYPRLEEITQEIARLETSQRRSMKQRDSKCIHECASEKYSREIVSRMQIQ